jgi:hypothetical protein
MYATSEVVILAQSAPPTILRPKKIKIQDFGGEAYVHNTLLGLPVEFWAIVSFGIAVAYYNFWPRPPRTATEPRTALQQFVLRWFHSLTWALLGLASLSLKYVGVTTAQVLGLLGLASYLIFMFFFVREKMRYPQG